MESYADEAERNDRAEALEKEQLENGVSALRFDPKEWREYAAFRTRTKATLPEIEIAWSRFRETIAQAQKTSELIAFYRSKRSTAGRSKMGLKQRDLALGRFDAFLGHHPYPAVDEAKIDDWIGWLRSKHGLGDEAVLRHFSVIRAMFNFPPIKKICRTNPCDYVEPPRVKEKDEVAVFNLRQAFDFFKANRNQREVGRLATEAFGGLRFSSAAKLLLPDLDFAEQGITLPGSKHKSERRHYVDGFPKNLWRWLKFAPADCWDISERNYMRLKSEAFIRAGFSNPGNVLRHTMPTMHLSAFKNAPALATILQHRNSTMLYQRYKGRGVPQSVGRAYFMITPKTVLVSFERFCAFVGVRP